MCDFISRRLQIARRDEIAVQLRVMEKFMIEVCNHVLSQTQVTNNPADRITKSFLKIVIIEQSKKVDHNFQQVYIDLTCMKKINILIVQRYGKQFEFRKKTYQRQNAIYFMGLKLPLKWEQIQQSYNRELQEQRKQDYHARRERYKEAKKANQQRQKEQIGVNKAMFSAPILASKQRIQQVQQPKQRVQQVQQPKQQIQQAYQPKGQINSLSLEQKVRYLTKLISLKQRQNQVLVRKNQYLIDRLETYRAKYESNKVSWNKQKYPDRIFQR